MNKRKSRIIFEIQKMPERGYRYAERREGVSFEGLEALMDKDELDFPSPIEIDLHIWPESDMIIVKGRLAFTLQMACSRCLKIIKIPLKRRFTLRYSRKIPMDVHRSDQEDIELTADQIGLSYYEGECIDITDDVQEQIILAFPLRPLCKEECKGLCPRCGTDLNGGGCECVSQKPSGPFDVLKDLKLPS
jgi:uncharacterized protein